MLCARKDIFDHNAIQGSRGIAYETPGMECEDVDAELLLHINLANG